ncbi:MAG: Na+/H+ antiporter NhaA [Acidimicrobiia bacterium]
MPGSRRRPPALLEFIRTEQAAGTAMVVAALIAIVWASLRPTGYSDFWETPLPLPLPGLDHFTVKLWINDGLMTLFFFVVGLEIKRETTVGELADRRAAALPVLAALGGMAVPALVYLAFTAGHPSMSAWAIPTATDIAFVLGICALAGPRVPASVRLFLLALAIADDIGGILVIALVYAGDIAPLWLLAVAAGVVAVIALQRAGVQRVWPYVPLGVWIWYTTLLAGVHPAIAGVVVGVLTPVGPLRGGDDVMTRIEERLHPLTSFVVVPVFALASAGVALSATAVVEALRAPVFWGVFCGLVVGKPIGVSLTTWITARTGAGSPGPGASVAAIAWASPLAGIGFTVAIFIATLALPDAQLLGHALIAILSASVVAAVVGSVSLGVRARSTLGQGLGKDST